jgi:hypothetical protein
VAIRHTHGKWRTTIRRPEANLADARARQDILDTLAAVRHRTGPSQHPPLQP